MASCGRRQRTFRIGRNYFVARILGSRRKIWDREAMAAAGRRRDVGEWAKGGGERSGCIYGFDKMTKDGIAETGKGGQTMKDARRRGRRGEETGGERRRVPGGCCGYPNQGQVPFAKSASFWGRECECNSWVAMCKYLPCDNIPCIRN